MGSWFGKVIGGTLGFALGGPIGAVAGAAFGHAFVDKKDDRYLASRPKEASGPSPHEQAQLIFFTAVFSMLAKISKADGQVSESEINAIEKFMQEDLHLDNNSRTIAIKIFREALNSPEPFEAFARQFYAVFASQPQLVELMIDILLRVSISDGKISPQEEEMLRAAILIFNYSQSDFDKVKSRHTQEKDRYYAVLGIDTQASDQQVKSAYRKLVQEYHPDKILSKGLPDEFVQFAEDKFKQIQEAYENIKKERGL